MTTASSGAKRFVSHIPPVGRWMYHDQYNGVVTPGQVRRLQFRPEMPGIYKQSGNHVQVPCIGIRINATVTSDTAGGAATLRASKLQLGSFFQVNITNSFNRPYMQLPLDLAKLHFIGAIVNAPAQFLDRNFYSDSATLPCGPKVGLRPKSEVMEDTALGASFPYVSKSRFIYPGLDDYDTYWRALEDLFTIRAAPQVVETVNFMYAIPLCAIQSGNFKQDSLPLNTLCAPSGGQAPQWFVEVSQLVQFEGRLVHADDTGAIAINAIELWTYNIAVPMKEPIRHGIPWWYRPVQRNTSPFVFQGGEVPLLTGTLPNTQMADTFTEMINAQTYTYRIAYPNVNADFRPENTLEYLQGQETVYPSGYSFERNPREVYTNFWNGGKFNHSLRTGLSTQVSIVGGRAVLGLGYANIVDVDLETVLGLVSSCPVRAFARTDLTQSSFPGLGTLDPTCGNASIVTTGTWNTTVGDVSNTVAQEDILVNLDAGDRAKIQMLGGVCCLGTEKFIPTFDDPTSPKADLVEGLTGYVQDMTVQNAAAALGAGGMASKGLTTG